MAILTREELIREIRAGSIEIDPLLEDCIGPGSIDLHLGEEFRVFKKLHTIYHVTDSSDFNEITELIRVKDHFVLLPGETVLGITVERIKLPPYLCGWLEGRSKFARLGLMVHITAGFMQPGINNRQVLEISNVSSIPLALHPGTRMCQFIFQTTKGEARYQGTFVNQMTP
ncbi:MAG TPA: dCTP deaminase [Candidatus Ozemobacteraceae bacterium]|nr:dCTP deaminase [Candidatus Ozemobacteraceae bacterium]